MISVQEPFDLPFDQKVFGQIAKLKGFVGIVTTWGKNGTHAFDEVWIQRSKQLDGKFFDQFTLAQAIEMTQHCQNMRPLDA